MEWTSSCLPEEMSADSHRKQEDPEHEPATKGRSYGPHIALFQATTPILEFITIPKNVLPRRFSSNTRTLSASSTPLLRVTPPLTNPS